MSDISFYHLTRTPLSQALPNLLERSMKAQKKSLIRIGSHERLQSLDSWLWVYRDDSWLPHGKTGDEPLGNMIWLTIEQDNPIDAEFLFVVENATMDHFSSFERIFYLFDGADENELQRARNSWKELKKKQYELAYWKQNDQGGWKQAI